MLKEIYVKDFVLIDQAVLQFAPSMSAFTGETGAGKSLLIDAISLLKGARSSASMVKKEAKKALVEAVFTLEENHPALSMLAAYGFDCEENSFIVTREISCDGKSTARINHRTLPLSMLKEVMENVLDIHSQHDTQSLLNNRSHMYLLDQYIHDDKALKALHEAYQHYAHVKHEYETALHSTYNEDELEYLNYQINEIEQAALSEAEEEELLAEQKRMQSFEKLSQHLGSCIEALDGSGRCNESLYEAVHELSYLDDFDDLKQFHDELNDFYYSIIDVSEALKDQFSQLEYDEERNNEIQERLYVINNLKRKYGGSISRVLETYAEKQRKVEMITHRQELIESQE